LKTFKIPGALFGKERLREKYFPSKFGKNIESKPKPLTPGIGKGRA